MRKVFYYILKLFLVGKQTLPYAWEWEELPAEVKQQLVELWSMRDPAWTAPLPTDRGANLIARIEIAKYNASWLAYLPHPHARPHPIWSHFLDHGSFAVHPQTGKIVAGGGSFGITFDPETQQKITRGELLAVAVVTDPLVEPPTFFSFDKSEPWKLPTNPTACSVLEMTLKWVNSPISPGFHRRWSYEQGRRFPIASFAEVEPPPLVIPPAAEAAASRSFSLWRPSTWRLPRFLTKRR